MSFNVKLENVTCDFISNYGYL